jgi:heme-degrading monooxygenase HmoA
MLIKWIIAEVFKEECESFSRAQRSRTDLRGFKGFVSQAGGWVQQSAGRAVILACWRDTSSYDAFAQNQHDALADEETGTYQTAETLLGSVITTINERDPSAIFTRATFLRVSDVTLRPDCSPIFMAAQMQIWFPALASSPGMVGALLSRVTGHKERFLMATCWRDAASFDIFRHEIYPALYDRAKPDAYIQQRTIYLVPLESNWTFVCE